MNKQPPLQANADFEQLKPERILDAVEQAVGKKLTGLTSPLPSYINRVYELLAKDGTRLIAKFYRPGRWSQAAILEEHQFVHDCAADGIPVIAPMTFEDGSTLKESEGIWFAVYPKKLGRAFEIIEDDDWERIGQLIARIHNAGTKQSASSRVILHPAQSTAKDIEYLVQGGFIPAQLLPAFKDMGDKILDLTAHLFDDIEFIRLHGDCHLSNILHRPGEGIMVIDFDDMMIGPPVQDIWLILPEHAAKCALEIDLILTGYEMFRDFDTKTLRLIEPLRVMRMIYFLAWCSRQANDYRFQATFPNWGSEGFWQKEIADIGRQSAIITEVLNAVNPQQPYFPASL